MEHLDEKVRRVLAEDVALAPWNSDWAESFRAESYRLKACLPGDIVGRIEHFGSTAVPGLAAKPIVDLLIEVRTLEETKTRIAPVLEAQGCDYFWRPSFGDATPPFYAWFIRRDTAGKRTHHIHMVEPHFEHWDRLLFRDRLIENPEIAARYAALKSTLSSAHGNDREAYTAGKTEFVKRVTDDARRATAAWRLAEAFNRSDAAGMEALLDENATAEVLGSGWPVEGGRAAIAKTSFPHLLDDAEEPLAAERVILETRGAMILKRKRDGAVDTILRMTEQSGRISRIEYLVTGFRRDEMAALVRPHGLEVAQ